MSAIHSPRWFRPRPRWFRPRLRWFRPRLRWFRPCFAALLAVVCAGPSAGAPSVGVAPFERSAGAENAPDFARLLADRLATAGVDQVVGPDDLGAPASARPNNEQVKAWARRSNVEAVVVGRTTRIGGRFSVDVQLRDGKSGGVADTYVTEVLGAAAAGNAVNELAGQVMAGLGALQGTPPPVSTASGGGTSARSKPASKDDGEDEKPSGLLGSGSGPISIKSEELEARQNDGARHLIFTRNVHATQDDLVLNSDRLDAYYPKGSSRPNKLVATGHVDLVRNDGTASCHKMTYLQADNRIHCEGDAELVRDGDRATGDRIEWDLETDTIYIKGNADVFLGDDD